MLCAFMYTILHVGTNHKVQLWVMVIPVVLLVREVGKLICFAPAPHFLWLLQLSPT